MRKESQLHCRFQSVFLIAGLITMCCYGLHGCAVVGSTAATVAVGEASLSKSRANIQVTEDVNFIKDCMFIKDVQAKSYWGGLLFQEKALGKTIADITHESAEAGANVLLIKNKTKTFNGSHSEGAAYLCPASEQTATPAKETLSESSQ